MSKIKLSLESVIENGPYKGNTVRDIIKTDKKQLFDLIKRGVLFEEEVYKEARIQHNVRDYEIKHEVVDKIKLKDTKIYPKETESVKKIMESLLTLNNTSYDYDDNYYNNDENENLNEIPDTDFYGD